MCYSKPTEPAPDINTLVTYLRQQEESDGKDYVYRGQVRNYEGPLVPSAYRPFLLKDCESSKSTSAGGERFAQSNYPIDIVDFTAFLLKTYIYTQLPGGAPEVEAGPAEITTLDRDIATKVLEDLRLRHPEFPPALMFNYDRHFDFESRSWISDTVSRRNIREYGNANPFGRVLGDLLCQQFGLHSGFLDCTSSLEVAAFFATHAPAEYLSPLTEASFDGVIIRFDKTITSPYQLDLGAEVPPLIVCREYVEPFEDPDVNHDKSRELLDNYLVQYFHSQTRQLGELRVATGSVQMSRIGRQKSVMLVPDLRVRGSEGKLECVTGVEDLRSRPGFQKFYFSHGGAFPSTLSRSYLWPATGDVFKQWIALPLTSEHPTFTMIEDSGGWISPIPKRPDLIDHGYSFVTEVQIDLSIIVVDRSLRRGPGEDRHEHHNLLMKVMSEAVRLANEPSTYLAVAAGRQAHLPDLNQGRLFQNLLDKVGTVVTNIVESRDPADLEMKKPALYTLGLLNYKAATLMDELNSGLSDVSWALLTSSAIADIIGPRNWSTYMLLQLAIIIFRCLERRDLFTPEDYKAWRRRCDLLLDDIIKCATWFELDEHVKQAEHLRSQVALLQDHD